MCYLPGCSPHFATNKTYLGTLTLCYFFNLCQHGLLMFLKGSHCHTYQLRKALCRDLKINIHMCQVFHWVLNEVEGLACLDELPPVVTEQFSSLIQGLCVACLLCARHRCTRGEQTWQAKRTKAHMNLYLYPAHSGKKQKN